MGVGKWVEFGIYLGANFRYSSGVANGFHHGKFK